MAVLDFPITTLPVGEYSIEARFSKTGEKNIKRKVFFRKTFIEPPAKKERIPIVFPKGLRIGAGETYPVTFGIPFPKGCLTDDMSVKIVDSKGKAVPTQTIVRSRWGSSPKSTIRWLGVDFQAAMTPPWWPNREESGYFLEFGNVRHPTPPKGGIKITETPKGLRIDAGRLSFLARRQGFNLLDEVVLDGKQVLNTKPNDGLYVVDHQGSVYRAANDLNATISVEEAGPLRAVLKVSGWLVKDGTSGSEISYKLPTDALCKFTTRIEIYWNKPYVRLLTTMVLTYDTFSVRLKDAGLSVHLTARDSVLGVDGKPWAPPKGMSAFRLIQHLPDECAIENSNGDSMFKGKHSDGWISAKTRGSALTVAHRDTWQLFPKEIEISPKELKFHIWPAHGRTHSDINDVSPENINRILFAHQGVEMNLSMPWKYYLSAAKISDSEETGVYSSGGQVLAGVHASAMGAATTNDFLFLFGTEKERQKTIKTFLNHPTPLPSPKWTCSTMALGYVHEYDKKRFPEIEKIISDASRGYWEVGNKTNEFGMWLYRGWHHETYLGNRKWNLYRLHNTSHHYEAYMPWLFLARSGDPFYATQGWANIRNLSDVGTIHYNDPNYPHRELHFHQGRIIGSQKHTNGLSPWAADHAVGAHLTCFNAMILAHYLTGDLRLKEVVDEWMTTILDRRRDPQYLRADRSVNPNDGTLKQGVESARDVNNFLGELIDLYMMNHNPKILALLEPRMRFFVEKYARHWGIPLQNVINFSHPNKLKNILHEEAEKYRKRMNIPASFNEKSPDYIKNKKSHLIWYTHTPFHNLSMAAALFPEKHYDIDAAFMAGIDGHLKWAAKIFDVEPNRRPFFEIPDYLNFLPALEFAHALSDESTMWDAQFNHPQPFPYTGRGRNGWSSVLIKKDKDVPLPLRIFCLAKNPIKLKVLDPAGKTVGSALIPPGPHYPFTMTIPKDGECGVYTLFLHCKGTSRIRVPFSPFPEVYNIPPGWWDQFRGSRFYVSAPKHSAFKCEIKHKLDIRLFNVDGNRLIKESLNGELSEAIRFEIPQEGGWLEASVTYLHVNHRLLLSADKSKWFDPGVLPVENPDKKK
jgi:hypothetical protein